MIINNTGLEGMDDLMGFTFNGKHSSEFRFIRVSGGKEFENELLPNRKDTTLNIPGQMGEQFLQEKKEKKTFRFQFAFDDMGESDIRAIKNWLSVDYPCDLVLDEEPYKTWKVKVNGIPKIKFNMFDKDDGSRVYKGTGEVQFIAYRPIARCSGDKKFLSGYPSVVDGKRGPGYNLDQWKDTAELFVLKNNLVPFQQINNPNFLNYAGSSNYDTFTNWDYTTNYIHCRKNSNQSGIKVEYIDNNGSTKQARMINTVQKLPGQSYGIIEGHKYYLTFSFRDCNLTYNEANKKAYLYAAIGSGDVGDKTIITDYRDNNQVRAMLNENFTYEYFFNAETNHDKFGIYTNYIWGQIGTLLQAGSYLTLDNVYLIDLTIFYNGQIPEDTNVIKQDLYGFSMVPIDSSVTPTPTGYNSYWNVYNAGDLDTSSKILLSYSNNSGYINIAHRQNGDDDIKMYIDKATLPSATAESIKYLTMDNNLQLLLETTISNSTYETGTVVLNKAIAGGDFFKIPPSADKTDIQGIGVTGASIISIDYDYLYY